MLKTFKPNNLVAIKGQYRDLNALNELGKEFNLKEINTAVLDNGNKILIEEDKLKKIKRKLRFSWKYRWWLWNRWCG